MTSSISLNQENWLWNLIAYNTPPDHWRSAASGSILASVARKIDDKEKMVSLTVMSNAFHFSVAELNQLPVASSITTGNTTFDLL